MDERERERERGRKGGREGESERSREREREREVDMLEILSIEYDLQNVMTSFAHIDQYLATVCPNYQSR